MQHHGTTAKPTHHPSIHLPTALRCVFSGYSEHIEGLGFDCWLGFDYYPGGGFSLLRYCVLHPLTSPGIPWHMHSWPAPVTSSLSHIHHSCGIDPAATYTSTKHLVPHDQHHMPSRSTVLDSGSSHHVFLSGGSCGYSCYSCYGESGWGIRMAHLQRGSGNPSGNPATTGHPFRPTTCACTTTTTTSWPCVSTGWPTQGCHLEQPWHRSPVTELASQLHRQV